VHNEAFNIGRTQENYQIRDVADIVTGMVAGSRVTYAEGGGPDERCYRVHFGKAEASLPGFEPQWTVPDGVRQLIDAYRKYELDGSDVAGSRFVRLRRIQELLDQERLSPALQWSSFDDPVATEAIGADL
jgi:hypothetical protein